MAGERTVLAPSTQNYESIISSGDIKGHGQVDKFGRNPDVDAAGIDIYMAGE